MSKAIRLRGKDALFEDILCTCRAILVLEAEDISRVADGLQWKLRGNVYEYYARFGAADICAIHALLCSVDASLSDLEWFVPLAFAVAVGGE